LVSPEGHDGHGLADHLLIPWAAITGDPDVWWVSVGLNQYYMCKQLYIYIYIHTYIYIYICICVRKNMICIGMPSCVEVGCLNPPIAYDRSIDRW
jgi:hypothetical protein